MPVIREIPCRRLLGRSDRPAVPLVVPDFRLITDCSTMLKPNASRRIVETDQRDNARDISIRRNSRGVVRADSQSHLPPIRGIADLLKRIIQVVGKHKAANIKTYVRDSSRHPNRAHLGILSRVRTDHGRIYRAISAAAR